MTVEERIERIRQYVSALDSQVSALEVEANTVLASARAFERDYKKAEAESHAYSEAAAVLSTYADHRQQEVRERLEGLVTAGLREVFGEDLIFRIRTKLVGKQRVDTYMTLTSMHDGVEVETSIMDSRGGGVAAVAGFLLRLVSILLLKAPRIMILDETFAQVSAEYEARLAEFLSELVERTGFLFVMVTHSTAYEDFSDVVYRTSQKDGTTVMTKVKGL